MKTWEEKVDALVKPPADARESILHWEIRNRFATLKDQRIANTPGVIGLPPPSDDAQHRVGE